MDEERHCQHATTFKHVKVFEWLSEIHVFLFYLKIQTCMHKDLYYYDTLNFVDIKRIKQSTVLS